MHDIIEQLEKKREAARQERGAEQVFRHGGLPLIA